MADEDWDFEIEDEIPDEDDKGESDDDTPSLEERLARLEDTTGKVVKKIRKDIEAEASSLVQSFMSQASDEEKDLADVFDLESLTSKRQVEKAIDKIKARAAKLDPDGHIGDGSKGDAFEPPITQGGASPATDDEKLTTRLKAGKVTVKETFQDFLTAPVGEWSMLE